MADERGKAIELAVSQIEKQFGKGSIMRLGSKEAIVPISVIPTGRSRSMRRWAWADFRAGVWWKCSGRSRRARRPLRCR